ICVRRTRNFRPRHEYPPCNAARPFGARRSSCPRLRTRLGRVGDEKPAGWARRVRAGGGRGRPGRLRHGPRRRRRNGGSVHRDRPQCPPSRPRIRTAGTGLPPGRQHGKRANLSGSGGGEPAGTKSLWKVRLSRSGSAQGLLRGWRRCPGARGFPSACDGKSRKNPLNSCPEQNRKQRVTRIEQLCADKGLRMTEQRRVIARVLSEAEDHPDAEELYRRASAIDPHISIATVYRTVRLFEEAGVVEKHDFGDGRSRYEQAGDDHHDHLINIKTGQVVEFFDEEIEKMKEALAKKL